MTVTAVPSSVIHGARNRAGNDPIFALNAEASQRAAAGESILNATLGALITDEGRLGIMPTVVETFSSIAGERYAGYAPISGTPAYREAIVRDLFGERSPSDRAVAVATPGGTGAVYQAVVNFLEPGQALLTTEYYWGPYRAIAEHSGRGIDTFPMFSSDGTFNLEGLESGLDRQASTQGRVLVVLNFPCHNPTGYSLGQDEWRRVAESIKRVGRRVPVTVLIDAAYMSFGGATARSWVNAATSMLSSATVLVAWTASKSFTQYGSRVGALVALHRDPDELDQIGNALGYSCRATWSNCNHVGQLAITKVLTEPALRERCDAERGELIDLLQERIDVFNSAAEEAGLTFPRYESGFFVAVFTKDAEVTAAKMRESGVYVVPLQGAVRVALCSTPAASIDRLVEALRMGVKAAG